LCLWGLSLKNLNKFGFNLDCERPTCLFCISDYHINTRIVHFAATSPIIP
jgi:hypothetical protein